jgi:drug/metabolite transporter (DMT)-like permease
MTTSPAAAATAHPQLLDWLTLGGLVVAWGSSFAMTKIAVGHLDAAWVMALRLAIGGVFLLLVLYASGRKLPTERHLWRWFTWLGLIGHALPFFLISWGTQFVSSGLSGVLMGAIPLFVIVAAHFFLPDEPMTRTKAAGFVIGFAGLMIVLGPERLSGLSMESDALKGEIAILLGCVCYVVHGLFARRIPFHGATEQATAVCLAAGIMGLAFALAVSPAGLKNVPWSALAAVLGLGVLPTALATLMMYRIMRTAGVTFVAYTNYLVPVYALGFGALTLGEALDWNVAAGLVLIIVGIAASRFAPSRLKGKI